MKTIGLFFLLVMATTQLFAADEAVPPKKKSKNQESHKFSEMTLQGQLKKPDLTYIYKRKGVRSEKIINVPEEFDNEIIQDTAIF